MSQRFLKSIILILFILLVLGIAYNIFNDSLNSFNKNCIAAEETLIDFQKDFNDFTNDTGLIDDIIANKIGLKQIKNLSDKYFYQFIYKGDDLIFWNNNSIIPEAKHREIKGSGSLLLKKNGYYIAFSKKYGDYDIIGMMLVKHQYSITNKYLNNAFSDNFRFKESVLVHPVDYPAGVPIKNMHNESVFKVEYLDSNINKPIRHQVLITYITIVVFWLFALFVSIYLKNKFNLKVAFISVLISSSLYIIMIEFFNFELKKTILFSPELYASQFYGNSLGHLSSYSIVLFAIALSSAFIFFKIKWKMSKPGYFIYSLFCFIFFIIFNSIIRSLILNSVISFEINNFILINVYTLIGIMLMVFLSLTAFIFLYVWAFTTNALYHTKSYLIIVSFFTLECFWFYFVTNNITAIVSSLISCTILLVFLFLLKNKKYFNKFNFTLSGTLLFTLLISIFLTLYTTEIGDLRKTTIAKQLSEDRDRVAEFKFNEIQQNIKEDYFFKKFFVSPFISQKELQQRINYLYFGGYMSKFNVNSIAFNIDGKAIKTSNIITLQYYYDLVNTRVGVTSSEWLFLLPKMDGKNNYLSILPIENDGVVSGTLVLELSEKTYQKENLYPELLIEQKTSSIAKYKENKNYEYAIYKNNYLVAQSGEFAFPYFFGSLKINTDVKKAQTLKKDGFKLNFIETDNDTKVVIGAPVTSPLILVSTFSYIFCLVFILSVITYLLIGLINLKRVVIPIKPIRLTFKNKINFAILFITIASFIIIGIVTISYFTELYKANNIDKLIKKQKSVLSSVEYLLNKQNAVSLDKLPSNFGTEIASLAEIHSIDINVFDIFGELIHSSQPSIFGNGLISKKMEPVAKFSILNLNNERYIQNENINKLHYESIYVPIRLKTGQAIAVLNLPYFAQEETLKRELSKLMVSLVNVYVLLLIVAAFTTFLISNSITSPLANISTKLSLINLGKKNERIEWKADDEIGALVKEYNKMIIQIEETVQNLAKSERESAWREMAKQIAHEIKNPLTPMKLSIQHLQRALKDDPNNAIPLAERVSKTMVEQIDNLSEIATAFSSFAQMPTAQKESVDLVEVLQSVVDLFNENEGTQIQFTSSLENAYVYSDKNQLLSVFNNLIKNAQQATEDADNPWVKIEIIEKEGDYVTSIKDNGEGISEERSKKIFVPNFTTKSSGTGLGLAISKQIIVNSNGFIWFQSLKNEGATFFVSLPKIKNN